MATPPDFVAGQVLTAAQMNKIGLWTVKNETTFTAASSVTADGIFTDDFNDYLILFTTTATGTGNPNLALQFRASGVTANTNYNVSQLVITTVATISRATSQTSLVFGVADNALPCVTAIRLFGPQKTQRTAYMSDHLWGDTVALPEQYIFKGVHDTAAAYDGFIVTPASSTITGYYSVYGYNE